MPEEVPITEETRPALGPLLRYALAGTTAYGGVGAPPNRFDPVRLGARGANRGTVGGLRGYLDVAERMRAAAVQRRLVHKRKTPAAKTARGPRASTRPAPRQPRTMELDID